MRSIDSLNYWSIEHGKNYPAYEPLFDDVQDHFGVLSRDEADSIAAYMEVFRDQETMWMSYPNDPFDNAIIVEQNGGEDDKYRWSGLLHYLIKKYRIDPPMEFRRHVRSRLEGDLNLQKLAADLNRSQSRRSPKQMREREWRRLKSEGGIGAAWVLYP